MYASSTAPHFTYMWMSALFSGARHRSPTGASRSMRECIQRPISKSLSSAHARRTATKVTWSAPMRALLISRNGASACRDLPLCVQPAIMVVYDTAFLSASTLASALGLGLLLPASASEFHFGLDFHSRAGRGRQKTDFKMSLPRLPLSVTFLLSSFSLFPPEHLPF